MIQLICIVGIAVAGAMAFYIWIVSGRSSKYNRKEPYNPNAHAYRRRGF